MMTEHSQNIGHGGFMPRNIGPGAPGGGTYEVGFGENGEHNYYGTGGKGCAYFFKKFDDSILRPIFVYKYEYRKQRPEISFDQILKETEQLNDMGGYNFQTYSRIWN
mmetsp:Transcript_36181/g.55570  ORF Transcript_36181/g.55570 Transcript_36181/m.55570 type:complete len:107 (+) Transcript_36181:1563-1883(+)